MTLEEEVGKGVLKELQRDLEWYKKKIGELDENQISDFAKTVLLQRSTIFVAGIGRSGFVAQAFAMRLAQMGRKVRVLGEPTIPPVRKGNLFIVVSGSGTNLVKEAKIAKEELGAKVIAITSYKDSPLAIMADVVLIIPGREKEDSEMPYFERMMKELPIFPLGTAFEGLTLLFLDGFTGYEVAQGHLSEKDMQAKHAKPQIH